MCSQPDSLSPDTDCLLSFEALEVKNHSPFRWDRALGLNVIQDPGPWAEVASWHVPQLALEMYCMGPRCRGAVFVSQSATKGAVIMRLRRNDDYIDLLLSELRSFHASFVVTGVQPPPDFGSTRSSHQRLLEATLAMSRSAEEVVHLKNHQIQRSPWGRHKTLFLDSHEPLRRSQESPEERREEAKATLQAAGKKGGILKVCTSTFAASRSLH